MNTILIALGILIGESILCGAAILGIMYLYGKATSTRR